MVSTLSPSTRTRSSRLLMDDNSVGTMSSQRSRTTDGCTKSEPPNVRQNSFYFTPKESSCTNFCAPLLSPFLKHHDKRCFGSTHSVGGTKPCGKPFRRRSEEFDVDKQVRCIHRGHYKFRKAIFAYICKAFRGFETSSSGAHE